MGGENRSDAGGAGEVVGCLPRYFLYSRSFAFLRGLRCFATMWRGLLTNEEAGITG